MRILIAGAGTIGSNLAAALAKEGQDVVVIDSNEDAIERLGASVDCQTECGNALSPQKLEELRIRAVDLLVAVTQDDATNMAVCRLADFYSVPHKLARIRNPELSADDCPVNPEHFGIDHIISPEGIAVDHIERLIACPGALEAVDFEEGRIAMRALPVSEDSSVAGERIIDVRQRFSGDFLIAALRRGGRVIIPDGDDELRIGDVAYLVCSPEILTTLRPIFTPYAQEAERVLIFGAGIAAIQLARRLAGRVAHIRLIEPDEAAATRAAEVLDPLGIEVLCGSPLDADLLARCNIDRVDFFASISDDDEENFMSALLFRRNSNGTPIVMTRQGHYVDILDQAGIDIVINPRVLAASTLLQHIRGNTVLSVARLHSEKAEILEHRDGAGSAVTREPLRSLRLPEGMLIAAVMRDNELRIPGGDFIITHNDRVVVFADERASAKVEALFR
ncbi:MAG: Trk system potassium transporter TrkA [Planctomycetota bacterium]|jgi:trk system potassium uptake protein TrkA